MKSFLLTRKSVKKTEDGFCFFFYTLFINVIRKVTLPFHPFHFVL